jgi:flagellar FliL protein
VAGTSTTSDKGKVTFVVVILLLTLVGSGAGFAVGALIGPPSDIAAKIAPASTAAGDGLTKANDGEAPANSHATSMKTSDGLAPADDAENLEVIDPRSLKAVVFPPVLTTLAEPKGKWIRLEGSILITAEAEDVPEILAERSGEQILTYLRSLRLDQLEGPAGVLGLREDLTEMLGILSKGQVKGLLINGLVVE